MSTETVIAMRSGGEMNHGHWLKKLQEGFNKKGNSCIHLLHSKGTNSQMKRTVESTQRGTLKLSIPWLPIQNTQIQDFLRFILIGTVRANSWSDVAT